MKSSLIAKFDEYATAHSHPTNRLTHKIAIPVIILHIVAMLDWITLAQVAWFPGGELTAGLIFLLVASVWYFSADVVLAVPVVLFGALCIPLGRALPVWAVVALALLGWGIQLAGHMVWEKKSPSFFRNLEHALVGPMFMLALAAGRYRMPDRTSSPAR